MNIAAEITPLLFIVATLAFLGYGFYRARQRSKAAILVWLQGLLLLLPWVIFLGLLSMGITLGITGFILMLLIFTVLYIGAGRQARVIAAKESETRRSQQMAERDRAGDDDTEPATEPPQMSGVPRISSEDLVAIQEIFGINTFFATESIPYGEGAIFKGNLRGEPESVVQELCQRLQQAVDDRYRLYLVEDPQEKPAVVVLPEAVVNQRSTTSAFVLATVLFVISLLAALETGANLLGFRLLENPGQVWQAVPVALGIFSVVAAHEISHVWMANRYGVNLSPAFIIPAFGIGTLGSINRFESPVPTRKALFDISLAGPAAGGILALIFLVAGLMLSEAAGDLYVPTSLLRSSILVGTLARLVLGYEVQSEIISIHSLVVVGWIGLAITALSLLPAGQLDGGRIVQAVYGRKTARRATIVTLIVLGIFALSNELALYWALLILFLARETERPPQDELTETDGQRDALALLALFLTAMTLLPIAPQLAAVLSFPG